MLYHHKLLDPLIALSAQKEVVLHIDGKPFTAHALWTHAKKLGARLYAQGVRRDDAIVLAFGAGPEFLEVMYACMLLRVKVAIIDPEMGRDLYAAKLEQMNPKWAFVDSRLLLLQEHPLARMLYFKLVKKAVYFPPHKGLKKIAVGKWMPLLQQTEWLSRLMAAEQPALPVKATEEAHDFLIVYTSGTLQEPKGVLLSLDALHESIGRLTEVLGARPGDRIGTYLPHFLLLGIASSVPVYYYNPDWEPAQKISFFRENKISILFGPPSDYLPLIKWAEENGQKLPQSFTHLLLGSAPVHPTFLQRLFRVCYDHTRISCTYGMTENLLVSVIDGRQKMLYTGEGDPVGKPVKGVEIQIAADGEILLTSPQSYTRYLHLAERDRLHATGDLGFFDEVGCLYLKGRKKEMIIRRNTNIYPALYEKTIKKISGVEEAVMVGVYSHQKQDEEVYLAVEGTAALTEKHIMEKLSYGSYQIEKEALPDRIIFMKIPRKGRQNKIDRGAIVQHILEKGL
jgi:acyl-CoA synthetase (AMP-forming)/AMP-acid ligase II